MNDSSTTALDAYTCAFPLRLVADLVNVQPRRHRIKTNEYAPKGSVPIIDQSTAPIAGYINDPERAYDGPLPVVVFGDHTCIYKFIDYRFAVGADGTQLLTGDEGVDTRFLYYALQTAPVKQFGYQRHFKLLKQSRVPVPTDIQVQRRIASILGAYDDLIEVNRRRIVVLEEIARRLFEEWFVYFRFPGHENVPLVSVGETKLPLGWEMKPLATLAAVNANTLRPASAPDRIGYIDISSVSVGTVEKVDWMAFADAPGRARRRVKDGSILWSMVRPNRRSFALLLEPTPDTIASTGFAVIDAKALPFAYLFQVVTTDAFVGYLTGNATGAAYPAVTGAVFERASIVVPPDTLASRYAEVTIPMLRLAAKLRFTNDRLAELRDILLPRLISGELPVSRAENELETTA